MPWLTVLILVTLVVLCWGGGWGIWRPDRPTPTYLMGVLGLILFVVLVVLFINITGVANSTRLQ